MIANRNIAERIAAIAVTLVALGLIAVGTVRAHKVYDPETEAYGIIAFTRVSDKDLVIDTTFGGVTRTKGRLYSTYDRTQPRGKKACPT